MFCFDDKKCCIIINIEIFQSTNKQLYQNVLLAAEN